MQEEQNQIVVQEEQNPVAVEAPKEDAENPGENPDMRSSDTQRSNMKQDEVIEQPAEIL